MEKRAKIFICHHPAGLLFFENLSRISKQINSEKKIILFKVNHAYFSKLDFKEHEKYFDQIIEFDFVHYNENFMKEYFKIIRFIKKLDRVKKEIFSCFSGADLFLEDSAWLPMNIMLYNLSKSKEIKSIFRFNGIDVIKKDIKTDRFKSFLCNLYAAFLPSYLIKFTVSPEGKFSNFRYRNAVPGKEIKIQSPANFKNSQVPGVLPFPVISAKGLRERKDMVFIMGDAKIFEEFSEYFFSYEDFLERGKNFFAAIEKKYPGHKICYKPHPADGAEIMAGIDPKKHIIFDNSAVAQTIFNNYYSKIKAVYSISSSSVIASSYFGIPSYVFYRYFMAEPGIRRMDTIFLAENIVSPFLLRAKDLSDSGIIDGAKGYQGVSQKELESLYKKELDL